MKAAFMLQYTSAMLALAYLGRQTGGFAHRAYTALGLCLHTCVATAVEQQAL
jgi:hypothetical protein